MAGVKLDGAGAQKMKTIEEALKTLQTMHGLVERMAIEVKNQRGAGVLPQQVKRMATPLQGQLKGQFGMIADQVSAMILAAGRGGGEQIKVRTLREHVAQIRMALEIVSTKVKEQHAVPIETAGGDE
ncbi:MAG: hypothetical protein OEW77_13075 [Gemmatimonadota bacterium]|nr:hypothetical protein [Gemmatimonadota bacterium]